MASECMTAGIQKSDGSAAFKDRKLEACFVVPFGKISIGQGDGAANGTSEEDLSGTYRVYAPDREDVSDIENIKQFMVGTRVKF